MNLFDCHSRSSRRRPQRSGTKCGLQARLAALLLCLSMTAGFLPVLARAEVAGQLFSSIVKFDSIALHYPGSGVPIEDDTLIGRNKELELRYKYTITAEQCAQITPGTPYYLQVSPHLQLPNMPGGAPLTIKVETGSGTQVVPFGKICADGSRAWVIFDVKEDGDSLILSDYVMEGFPLENANFYLNCNRATDVPENENPIDGQSNLYAMKFENGEQITFGYAEYAPVTAKAQIEKNGSLTDKTITWIIDYTPWQNPNEDDEQKGITLETPFELHDVIHACVHTFVDKSVKIDGNPIADTAYHTSRDSLQDDEDVYVIVEPA